MRDVCAVIVTYNPSVAVMDLVRLLVPQVGRILLVDNGSHESSRQYLELAKIKYNVQVVNNGKNLGLAAALNIGAKCAVEAGYAWLATFDQDSKIEPGFIQSLMAAYQVCTYKDRVAVVSPVYKDPTTGKIHAYGKWKKGDQKVYVNIESTMTSGNLVKIEALERVGGFKEAFFIDYVDFEFCLRCLKYGYCIIESQKSVLHHSAGEPTHHSLLGWQIAVSNHKPVRRYYNARNRIAVYKEYIWSNPAWVLKDVFALVKEVVKTIVFESNVPQKLSNIVKGGYHGLVGKMGRYE